jgi:hypothetical protein
MKFCIITGGDRYASASISTIDRDGSGFSRYTFDIVVWDFKLTP